MWRHQSSLLVACSDQGAQLKLPAHRLTGLHVVLPCFWNAPPCNHAPWQTPIACLQDARARAARTALSRAALVADLRDKGLPSAVPEDIRQILTLLESDFKPLELCRRLQPLLEKLPSMGVTLSSASPVGTVDPGQFRKPLQQVRRDSTQVLCHGGPIRPAGTCLH